MIGIIGGGASGLVASIVAARSGAKVKIFEKSNRVGKKILATGNGRCNYTNVNATVKDYHGTNTQIVNTVFDQFGVQEALDFFEEIGIYPRIEENGKVYPYSLQASSILDNLRYEAIRLGVEEVVEADVRELRKNKGKFDIVTKDNVYSADKVIICTGGRAGSQYGCTGDGYRLAKIFGHKVKDTFPALVQLKLESSYLKRISGVKFDGVVASYCEDNLIRQDEGELLFTDYGISGPPIIQISRETIAEFAEKKNVIIKIDMFPEMSSLQLYEILKKRFENPCGKSLEESLNGFVNKKLIPVILMTALGEYKSTETGKLNKKTIYSIVNVMKSWQYKVIGYNDWKQAQSTAGGVLVEDIDFNTMESKKVKGLYLAGEVVDIDGDCGGFNLQWAWSSGYVAGLNASKK